MADSLYAQPSQPIEMKVFQGGGLPLEGGGAGTSLLSTPATPIEMKVYQGGGKAARQVFEKGLNDYKQTKYFQRIQGAPRKPNAAIYFIDTEGRLAICKRRDPGDKAKDGKIMAAGGAVDPSDQQQFPANPSILAALREGTEEIGINPFGIKDFTALTAAENKALTASIDEFIPLWNHGQVEAYIYLLKKVIRANGPDAQHKGELYTNYDFKDFGTDPALVSKQKQGVAYVDIQHLLKTVVGNPTLEFTYYTKFFRILGAIQVELDVASMDAAIHQIITGGGKGPAPSPQQSEIPQASEGRFIANARGVRRMRNNENKWGNTNSSTESNTPATKKLSNGYTVRIVDDSVKDDIQTLQFTEDERQVFEKELQFDHPFIREWLQKDENKEKWYEFWKTYINFDGSDKFHLMTYQEGKMIQAFKKEVLEAYRQYLLSAALPFLLKTSNPKSLKEYFHPPEAKKGFLFETVQPPAAEEDNKSVKEGEGDEGSDGEESVGSSGANTLAPFRRARREAYIKSDAAGEAELEKQGKMGIHLGKPTPEEIKKWRSNHYKKEGKAPITDNASSVTSFNFSEEETNEGTSYSGESETTAGTTSSTNTTESDESTMTNGESIEELDLNHVQSLLFEPVSNKNINALLPAEERIVNAVNELNSLIPNMPALRDYVNMKKGEAVFKLDESKLSADGFFDELGKVEFTLLTLLRLLIRVDITHFSDQESFTKFFLKLFNPQGKNKLKAYFEQEAPAETKGGGLEASSILRKGGGLGKKSLRKRIKATRKKTKTKGSTASSSRSQARTSRKGRSK